MEPVREVSIQYLDLPLAQLESETAEAKKYDMGGTPGTLLLNVKTGKYATVEGAFPFSQFTQKIDSIK